MMMDENQRTVEEYQVEEHRTKEISAESRRVKRNYERRDYLLALIMAAASFVYVRGSEFFSGAWLPLFTALFVSAGVFYLHSLGRRMDREGKTSLFFLIAGAVWFLVKYLPGRQEWELQGIMPYVTLFLHGAGVYWLLTVSGARIKGVLDESCILDLGKGFFALPFMNFGEVFLAAAHGVKQFRSSDQETKKKQKDKAGQILFGVMMSIPVLVIVLPMLAGADESFSAFVGGLSNLCSTLTENFFEALLFGNLLLNLMVILGTCYFYGLFYGAFHAKSTKEDAGQVNGSRSVGSARTRPRLSFSSAVCGVYVLFFLVKFSDILAKAFSHQQSFVYSDYARQGFFELCFISVINFGLFYFIKVFSDREKKTVKLMLFPIVCGDSRIYYACFFQNVPLY